MSLLPHDEKFFDLLVSQARIAAEASSLLSKAAANGSQAPAAADQIRDLERKGDDLLHDIFRRLHKSFITPVDPEDIHGLASQIDEILDHIEAAAYRLDAFAFADSPPQIAELAAGVGGCVQLVLKAMETLDKTGIKKPDDLSKLCEEINAKETEVETKIREAIRSLFASEKDAISLIKQKENYERLEKVGDACEDLADILEAVAVKNS